MVDRYLKFFFALLLIFFTLPALPTQAQETEKTERIAFAAYRHGQWDIYSIAPDGSAPRQLTNDAAEDTDPAYAPDGIQLAYASRRNNNWDVYVLNLQSGEETRLTNSPHYDGAPSWSPDGKTIAYESYQNGDLDIWQIDTAGTEPALNLTAASDQGDFSPAWSPDGKSIAFTSWQEESKDLFLLTLDTGEISQLTNAPAAEEWPAWHPDGNMLAYVIDDLGDREIYTLEVNDPPASGGSTEVVTWLGRTDAPVWSPAGDTLAALFHRWDGEIITQQTPGQQHKQPQLLTNIINAQGRLTWHKDAIDFGQPVGNLSNNGVTALYQETLSPNEPGEESYNMVRINDLETGTPWLADTVDDSFLEWRYRLRDEVGYDFLGTLSDAARDVGSYSETSQYASWHKSGRAVDTLFDYHLEGQLAHEIVREDYSGETYWRIFLRCADQSGECGRPITANPWNYSSRARTEIAPDQGGILKANISGYYVDMTVMAHEYGWERISSHDDEEYSWTWHFLAFEYWHYQKRLNNNKAGGASNWYLAMADIYPPQTLTRFFNWQKMRSLNENPYLIALKGVPLPQEMKPWWELVEQE